ncbi:carbamoyltransferase HypF [Lysinibacillus sp. NPDC097287]|uniref:carbamoyltransferase HypF n=1 Tax=Lysinibacillus sp. NPDC097287 TaxID=3364144 RepID=UPI003805C600
MSETVKVSIVGKVQGVGFRPFIYQLANEYGLKGTVQNNMDGVEVFVEGELAQVELFLQSIEQKVPRLSRIDQMVIHKESYKGYKDFSIIKSRRQGTSQLVIPVDAGVCDECLSDMNDPNNSRYQYPFITCTQCGPRYTIIDELPYDRPFTSMAHFDLCPICESEYNDPIDRRHHAQPIACPECGPHIKLVSNDGSTVAEYEEALKLAGQFLLEGKIMAVKGIGGFHLCCDASNDEAVALMRKRKNRPNRPLAVMSFSIDHVKDFAVVSAEEEQMLKSPEAPIVILKKQTDDHLAEKVAPDMKTIGVMLPYAPLHYLLLKEVDERTLVMTSANASGLPIVYKNEECSQYLGEIADFYLIHNRNILHPSDDSIVQMVQGSTDFFRKSRGYSPDALFSKKNVDGIVSFGGQQKTTFALGRNHQVFIGPHIGDLDSLNTLEHYKNELQHLLKWVKPNQEIGVIDYHPNYQTRQLVNEFSFKEVVEVQHHHAHMAACLADNGIEEKTFAIILDGTGYGFDGNIWGFEVFYGDCKEVERLAHLHYTALPGGEACIREPWRNAVGMLLTLLGEEGFKISEQLFPAHKEALPVLRAMVEKGLNTVYAGSCGRLFDAVSSMLGICDKSTYDGEAAISLSELANVDQKVDAYSYEIKEHEQQLIFNFSRMLLEIVEEMTSGKDVKDISTAFHETIVQALVDGMNRLHMTFPQYNKKIVLSGGSFHNRYLKKRLIACLSTAGFEVYTHHRIPCNDGGLSYGQLMVAASKREERTCV